MVIYGNIWLYIYIYGSIYGYIYGSIYGYGYIHDIYIYIDSIYFFCIYIQYIDINFKHSKKKTRSPPPQHTG